MFPKPNRLELRSEIGRLKSRGKRTQGEMIDLVVAPREESLSPRFACIVTKKIAKQATERNRVKRLLRAGTRALLKDIRGGSDVLIIAKAPAVGRGEKRVQEELRRTLKKAGLIEET
ncbi:MAG: ribonuclease P protein component [Candidatus Chisholmbacteria bacterium RIFCSPHIGHO2_12_FULL_49_9]|uniref:Ribonuclease P protein component n=1 Tax=Candidatus Chisholmbacteria bacterium RIFCSPHIGHO2_01_FULL_52_32 TaxID=1797591 RepID=A0A1G1VUI8_9BACT|nr:MAG: ribonuclease P protein component [Candidatus Chisholmbacteria bacterium RIFCSPHIGHO2_01_FULL_52_32]OGY19416.1 MAG: ribonuclease P protein component [Candidatus Chisholmbacteria bacterium RIFCSPHIGHO2_12_FULL_49_9]OGY19663.1 MAG: ribonuclease P protein component [Candidatus Chisholmbacteria bacterium RIFCSPLOWO2_01_FULL_50_28]